MGTGAFDALPNVFSGVRPQSNHRGSEEIRAALGTAIFLVPRSAISNADIKKIELRIVNDRVPNRAASSDLPPFACPGLGGLREDWLLKWFRRITGHGIKAPHELACIRIVGRDVAAHAKLRRRRYR
jgi:hypothetical protein